jgi:hypothetical protein
LNKDGAMDAISGGSWFEGPTFTKKRKYTDLFTWGAYPYDFNQDGWTDLFVYTCACVGGEGYVLENPKTPDGSWKTTKVSGLVGSEQVLFVDVDGDKIPEMLSLSDYKIGWLSFDPKNATKTWKFNAVTPQLYRANAYMHGLGFGDIDGDGDFDILETMGWWERPKIWDGVSEWKFHKFQFGDKNGIAKLTRTDLGVSHELFGASTLWAYDVDADGDQDVVTALDAHGWGIMWYEQLSTKTADGGPNFTPHFITGNRVDFEAGKYPVAFSQAHFINLEDMNRDGILDLVTGKRYHAHGPNNDPEPGAPPVTYWFELKRETAGVKWIPHLMDDATGIGVQFEVGDLNGDGYKDAVISSYKASAVLLQQAPFAVAIRSKQNRFCSKESSELPTLLFHQGHLGLIQSKKKSFQVNGKSKVKTIAPIQNAFPNGDF